MNLSKRELQLQEMRIRGRKAKQSRLSKAIKVLRKQLDHLDEVIDTSDIPETSEGWLKKAKVVKPKKGKRHGKKSVSRNRNAETS